jgi:hypothetical protein
MYQNILIQSIGRSDSTTKLSPIRYHILNVVATSSNTK